MLLTTRLLEYQSFRITWTEPSRCSASSWHRHLDGTPWEVTTTSTQHDQFDGITSTAETWGNKKSTITTWHQLSTNHRHSNAINNSKVSLLQHYLNSMTLLGVTKMLTLGYTLLHAFIIFLHANYTEESNTCASCWSNDPGFPERLVLTNLYYTTVYGLCC